MNGKNRKKGMVIKMKEITVKKLTPENFEKFGRYGDIGNPSGQFIGKSPVRFYRDILPFGYSAPMSASTTLVEPKEFVVDTLEYHTCTPEILMMLDQDAVICIGAATAQKEPPMDNLEAFYIPKGVMVYLNPGVWHYAPFPLGDMPVHSLVLLPERTYVNDTLCIAIEPDKQVAIKL